jgi:hypothetical protein
MIGLFLCYASYLFYVLQFLEQLVRTMEELDMGNTSHDRSK